MLRTWDSVYKLTILSYCVIPSQNYTFRVQRRRDTEELATVFDDAVTRFWSEFAEIEVTELNKALAQLPVRSGGCGFTQMKMVQQIAYVASQNGVMREGPCQKELMADLQNQLLTDLKRREDVRAHLEDAAVEGNACFYTTTKDANLLELTTNQGAAALRTRLATPHRDIQRDEGGNVRCPGCKENASTCHAVFKDKMVAATSRMGIHSESKEPNFAVVTCPTCKTTVDASAKDWAEAHASDCNGCDARILDAERKRRPDIRWVTEQGEGIVTDLSLAGITAKANLHYKANSVPINIFLEKGSGKSVLEARLAARERKKNSDYSSRVKAAGDVFYPAAASPMGSLSPGMKGLITTLYANRTKSSLLLKEAQFVLDVKRMIHSVSAGALMNAERRAGATHVHQHNVTGDAPWVSAPSALGSLTDEDLQEAGSPTHRPATAPAPGATAAPAAPDTASDLPCESACRPSENSSRQSSRLSRLQAAVNPFSYLQRE